MVSLTSRLILAAALLTGVPALAADAPAPAPKSSFTPAQRAEMNKLIHSYIVEHPEVITEAVQALQAKDEKERAEKQKKALVAKNKELHESAEGTVIGNPKGDVTLVEFFDYNCGYCKSMFPSVMETLKEDGKVRLVLKEFPILGPSSMTASKAALASVKQGKYSEFHVALMSHKGHLSDDTVMKIAKDTGLDVAKLQADMKSDDVMKVVDKNHDLGRDLDINGTPWLMVGETVAPGAIEKAKLKEMIAKARGKA
jgi:protein-disulfide isomerase